jgi:Tol biopolymer transport system component
MDRYARQLFLLLFSLLLLSACGGGGGGGDSSPSTDDKDDVTNDPPVTYSDINGDLNGRLFIAEAGEYFDLSTGLYTTIASDHYDVMITPSPDGKEYVERTKSYRMEKDNQCYGFLIEIERIAIRDVHSNLIQDSFELYEDVWGPAKLSPDGEAIALDWANDKGCPSGEVDALLTVFNRQGEVLSQTSEEVGSFAWLPDNRLIYANNGAIYVGAEAYSVDGVAIRSLDEIPGFPSRIRTNPDGSKIIFEMVTGGPMLFETVSYRDATVWMMNSDGSDLHQFATTRRVDDPDVESDDPRVNNPLWSLSGDRVIAMEGYFSGVGIVFDDLDLNPNGDYIIVPVDRKGLTYSVSANESQVSLPPDGQLEASIVARLGSNGIKPFVESCDDHLFLVPVAPSPDEAPGSLPPSTNSAINRGIDGNILFVNDSGGDTVVSSLNVETGNMTDLVTLSADQYDEYDIDFSVSQDARYFAYYDYVYLDEKYIKLFDSNGDLIRNYYMVTDSYDYSPRGRIHFSPTDANLLLFEYEDEVDDKNYVTVLDWSQNLFIKYFTSQEYFDPLWTPDGNIILWDSENTAYRANVSGTTIGDPVELFRLPEPSAYHAINPDGTRMVFYMARHIWTINMDGSGLKQITAPKIGYETYPAWSPDGRHILLKRKSGNSFGSLWIVASDAEHIRVTYNSDGVVPVRDSDGYHLRRVYGPMTWME